MSIPFWQPPPTPDFSGQMGNTVNLVGAVKDYQAKNALQGIYQNAIDPTTGAFDQQKFNLGVRNSPAALWNAGKEMEQSGQAQEAMGRGTVAQTQAYRSQLDNMAGVYADIANSPVKVPPAILQQRLDREYQSGGVNSQYYQAASKVISNMDPNDDGREIAREQLLINQDAKTRLEAYMPHYGSADTGPSIIRTQENPWRPDYGQPVPGVSYTKAPGPTDMATVTIMKGDHKGETYSLPLAVAKDLQLNGFVQIMSDQSGGNQPPLTNKDFGPNAGRYPQKTSSAPTVGASLAPGETGGMEDSSHAYTALAYDANAAQGRIFTAQQALDALQHSVTGKGTEWLQGLNSIIGTWQPDFIKQVLGSDYNPQELSTNRDLAEKYLTQIAMANANRLGPGTDAKLAASFTGNPSTHIQNLAAQDVLHVQIGLDRMLQLQHDEMREQGVSRPNFLDWQTNWTKTHDPRAAILDELPPERQQRVIDQVMHGAPREKDLFVKSLKELVDRGYAKDPTGGVIAGYTGQ